MKNRASLLLTEQLIMVLVFALAAALCLGVFGKAWEISRDTACREQAAVIAQNAAEALKAGEDPAALPLPEGYGLKLQSEDAIPGLWKTGITVTYEGEDVFSLVTGGQQP